MGFRIPPNRNNISSDARRNILALLARSFDAQTTIFNNLDDKFPLLLFPIRLETKFRTEINKLQIRIIPDQILINDHEQKISEAENIAGIEFWESKRASTSTESLAVAWEKFLSKVGKQRGPFIARMTEHGSITDLRRPDEAMRARSSLLPDRWFAVGYTNNTRILKGFSAKINREVVVSPDFANLQANASNITLDADTNWLTNFNSALEIGMGIEIELDSIDGDKSIVEELYVFGIRNEIVADSPALLDSIFQAHLYTQGAAFVPQGTPTNNTEDVNSGWTALDTDANGIWNREFGKSNPVTLLPSETFPDEVSGKKNHTILETALGLKNSSLQRFARSDSAENPLMEAMNTLLFEASIGEYLDTQFTLNGVSLINDDTRNWIYDWFRLQTKGCPLPVIRLGTNPYGFLPVCKSEKPLQIDNKKKKLNEILNVLRRHWRKQNYAYKQLTEKNSNTPPGERLIQILSAQPNPSGFSRVMQLQDKDKIIEAISKLNAELLKITAASAIRLLFGQKFYDDLHKAAENVYRTTEEHKRFYTSLEDSIKNYEVQVATNPSANPFRGTPTGIQFDADLIHLKRTLSSILEILESLNQRSKILNETGLNQIFEKGQVKVPGADCSFTSFEEKVTEWPSDRIVNGTQKNSFVSGREYINLLYNFVKNPSGEARSSLTPPYETKTAPLLAHFIFRGIEKQATNAARLTQIEQALEALQNLPDTLLETLFEQSIGLVGTRLDAWFTSLANQRLTELRTTQPHGIQFGAYGWVHDLTPENRESGKHSLGFVHAPSINHAKTAAILKAGLQAHQDSEALAIDLSSQRMRRAAWLFDAVREGQDLGDALGYLFERALHKKQKDHWIYPLRKVVEKEFDNLLDPTSPVVDGMEILGFWKNGVNENTSLEKAAHEFFPISDPENPGVTTKPSISEIEYAFLDLADAADAMADVAIADCLHSLVQGNMNRAGATLSAISRGENLPPELNILKTQRSGRILHHKAMLFAPLRENHSWFPSTHSPSPRAALAPEAECFLNSVLGNPAGYLFNYAYKDEAGVLSHSGTMSLVDLFKVNNKTNYSLSAQDIFNFLTNSGSFSQSALEKWLLQYLDTERSESISSELQPVIIYGNGSANETEQSVLLLHSWKECFNSARSLSLKDFSFSDSLTKNGVDWVDLEAWETRINNLNTSLTALIEKAEAITKTPENITDRRFNAAVIRPVLLEMARMGLAEAVPTIPSKGDSPLLLVEQLYACLKILLERKEIFTKNLPDNTLSKELRIQRVKDAVKAIFNQSVLILPKIKLAQSLDSALSRSTQLLGGTSTNDKSYRCFEWLEKMQYVRPHLRTLSEALLLQETRFESNSGINFKVAQWPEVETDKWSALEAPASDEHGRFSLLAGIPGNKPLSDIFSADNSFAGIFLDEVIECLPNKSALTAASFHFDAPNTEPPQTMLLAVAPEGATWNFDLMVDTLRETFEWVKLRSLNSDDVDGLDSHLPMVFSPKEANQ